MLYEVLHAREPGFSTKLYHENRDQFNKLADGLTLPEYQVAADHHLTAFKQRLVVVLREINAPVFAQIPGRVHTYVIPFSELNKFIGDNGSDVVWWPTHFASHAVCKKWIEESLKPYL